MTMKIPCEVVVKDILPMIRRELSITLVKKYGLSQTTVAHHLDITDAAVSQYLRAKRGNSLDCAKYSQYPDFMKELDNSAMRIVAGDDVFTELCRLCGFVKSSGLLAEVYMEQTGSMPKCIVPED